jgi:hypothetical protein
LASVKVATTPVKATPSVGLVLAAVAVSAASATFAVLLMVTWAPLIDCTDTLTL